jgi:hypothetical protein
VKAAVSAAVSAAVPAAEVVGEGAVDFGLDGTSEKYRWTARIG